jgi:hypothetical protein
MLILSMFLDQKSAKYFLRKTYSNFTLNSKFFNLRPVFPYILTFCVIFDSKIKSLCHADSRHIFGSKIGQALFEKNPF